MRAFFANYIGMPGETAELESQEQDHLFKTLRARPGEQVRLLDGHGTVGTAEIIAGRRLTVLERNQVAPPDPCWILCCAAPRRQKFDSLLKQAAELGVREIRVVHCARSVALPEGTERWQALLREGCKQSGNPFLPEISVHHSLERLLPELADARLFYGAVTPPPRPPMPPRSGKIAFFVGPEGGFAPEEEQLLVQHGVEGLSLGPWILRLETAAVCGLAALRALAEAHS